MDNSFVSIGQCAIEFGTDYGTIYRLVKAKKIASTKINNVTVIHRQHLKAIFQPKNKNLVTILT